MRCLNVCVLGLCLSAIAIPSPRAGARVRIKEITIPQVGTEPWGIIAGPNRDLWFTELISNEMGTVTTNGNFDTFPVATDPFARPRALTFGPDGAVWFTSGGPAIGRMTGSGATTAYAISSDSQDITVGPDGALWFTEYYANLIGRVTTSGEVTEFPIPTPNSGVVGITAGPDGALWFAEIGSIGRITVDGVVTNEFATGSHGPEYITTGPDGNLWFTEGAGIVGRITPQGQITQFTTNKSNEGGGGLITVGPDKALWFTAPQGNQIARVTTGRRCDH